MGLYKDGAFILIMNGRKYITFYGRISPAFYK